MLYAMIKKSETASRSPSPGRVSVPWRACLMALGVIVAIFIGYEIVERLWLTAAAPRTLYWLHIVRGVGSSLAAVLAVGWYLLRTRPFGFPQESVSSDELLAAQDMVEARLAHLNVWFIRMRWIACLIAAILTIVFIEALGYLEARVLGPLAATIGALALSNVAYTLLLRWRSAPRRLPIIQIVADLLILTLLLHFSGGIENPLAYTYIFHVIIAGIMLRPRQCHAVAAFRSGAVDYVLKPLIVEDVVWKIERILECRRLEREVLRLRCEVSRPTGDLPLVGDSAPMRAVLELIRKVAATGSTVLIGGESGTGKELAARAIHAAGERADEPFMAVNCAGVPESLVESELFGHARGAFTGAERNRVGFFEQAGGGTLFLDEISEMPVAMQAKLLRALEEKEFVRVGETTPVPLLARVIASTNRDLRNMIAEKAFRADLYFRVAVFELRLPPLRERLDDIPPLVEHFIRHLNREMKRDCRGASTDVLRALMTYDWPGNVRELRNVLERAMILSTGAYLASGDLSPGIAAATETVAGSDRLQEATDAYVRAHIRRVLRDCAGNKKAVARRLGVNSSTLYRKMAALGIVQE